MELAWAQAVCRYTGKPVLHLAPLAVSSQMVREAEKFGIPAHRSEEHTSELQSLMRISYAVFCLKKKTTTIRHIEKYYYCNTGTLDHHSQDHVKQDTRQAQTSTAVKIE